MPHIPAQALYEACAAGDAAAVGRLLPGTRLNLSGPRFQAPNGKTTPLILAAGFGHKEIVRMMLVRAPNTAVDYMSSNGYTALLAVAQYHHADIVRLLTDRGSNVNATDLKRRTTPLGVAVTQLNLDASPRDPDPDGARQLATVSALLQLGASTLPPCPSDTAALAQPFLKFPPKNPCATLN